MPEIAIQNELENLLEVATCDALETMCFFGVLGGMDLMTSEEQITAGLTFRGDASGVFHATVDYSAAWSVAANFLGEEPLDIELAQVHSVICELANMICGAVLSGLRRDGLFELSTPEIVAFEDSQSPREISRVFELESGSIRVTMAFDDSVPDSTMIQ